VYTLATARGETRVAVNLMNAEESDLNPRPLPTIIEGMKFDSLGGLPQSVRSCDITLDMRDHSHHDTTCAALTLCDLRRIEWTRTR